MVKFLATLVAVVVCGFSQAQSFKISVGYGIPWISQPIGTNSETAYTVTMHPQGGTSEHHVSRTSDQVNASYGAGFNASGAYTYKLAEHIALELGLTYAMGKKYSIESSYKTSLDDIVQSTSNERETSQSRAWLFTPALKFMTHKRVFTPYFSLGPVLGKINFRRSLAKTSDDSGITASEYRNTKFMGGIALGLRGAVGASVTINKKLSWFTEINFTGMNYYAKKSEITSYIVNGEDKIQTLSQQVRNVQYVNKVSTDTSHANDVATGPGKSLRFPLAMSAISLNLGVVINLY